MPLIQSKSKKALKENIETEMNENPNKKQAIAIAFNVQRKNKRKKMADGGMVKDSAKMESRPMPDERAKDATMVSHNSSMKAPKDDSMTSQAPQMVASRPRMAPLSRPRMAQTDAFKVKLRDQEEPELMDLDPASPKDQPARQYDEEGPDRQGPKVHPLKMMAKGGMINKEVSMDRAEEDEVEHPAGLEEDDDQMSPAKDEYMAQRFAEGGSVHREEDMQPMDEEEMEHHASVAAAIMAKKQRQMQLDSGSVDEDDAEMYAEGGMVDIDSNAEESPNSYYKQNRAALKENYDSDMDDVSQPMDSNEHGDELSDEDSHDMVSSIRRKMSMKRQFSK